MGVSIHVSKCRRKKIINTTSTFATENLSVLNKKKKMERFLNKSYIVDYSCSLFLTRTTHKL